MFNKLTSRRILSIDIFRGITILVMVFVNELAGIREIPSWMKHMPKDADAMSFVDLVFPAFLFIAGMSIPFALNNRLLKGDDFRDLQKHILWRTIGLLTLGLFMVNADATTAPLDMPISIHVWALLFYICAILVWNVYTFKNKKWIYFLRGIGIGGLIILAIVYRGGQYGEEHLRPRWWGILGFIGWAYLFNCIFYQIFRGKISGMTGVIILCTVYFAVSKYFHWDDYPGKNSTHIAIMACGIITSIIFFDEGRNIGMRRRFAEAFIFSILLLIAGYFLRPYYTISKIWATPAWGFYCSAICCILYSLLYWIVDIKGWKQWGSFVKPAASNPLLTYLIPDIIFAITASLHFSFLPMQWRYGMPGIIWCAFFAIVVIWIAAGLNKIKIRLQL
ncbi:MAG TPA: DUF5009 domain-containing protein [Puia sp.]|nr:DUF5009 domain-containing protein [Puia sp.]